MPATFAPETCSGRETEIRLRRDVFDALMAERNAKTVNEQVVLLGLSRATYHRIRRGDTPSLSTAMKMADALGVPFTALFERTSESA